MFNFEKLDVWQEAIQFADLVYELTGDFPDGERFGLTNQMRRAAVSISSNLAEGSSRVSRTDFGRFVEIATGSLFEVVSQTTIALRRRMIAQNDYKRIYAAAEKPSTVCYAGAPPRAPGSGGVTSGAATTCLGGFSAGIFLSGGGAAPRGGLIKRPCSTISLICEPSSVSYSSSALAITSSLSRFAMSVFFAS